MANEYREVGGKRTYPKFKECEEGDVLVDGVFRRSVDGKYGEQFEFENHDGEVVVLNGAGQLKYKMDFVKVGDNVKIIYEGEQILETGAMRGRPAHQFKVFLKDGDDEPGQDTDDELDDFEEL